MWLENVKVEEQGEQNQPWWPKMKKTGVGKHWDI